MSLHNSDQLTLGVRTGPKFRSYRKKDINRLSGVTKYRQIYVPNAAMRQLQQTLLNEVRSLRVPLPHATASQPGTSIFSHVQPHIGHQYVVQYDLEDAYGTVQAATLDHLLRSYGSRGKWIAEVAVRYSMHAGGGLITGAAASPDLFNIYAAALIDAPLTALLQEWGDVCYTRYLDDLVFSSEKAIGRRRRSQILDVIRATDFQLSHHKTRISDLATDPHVVINGIGVRITGDVFVARSFKRQLFTMLHQAAAGELSRQLLAGKMGAFYAAAGTTKDLTGSERRIHQLYQKLLGEWRSDPSRIARRTQRQREYRFKMGAHERSRRRKEYRRSHPQRYNRRGRR